jgi:hypothetical protein
MNWIRKIIVFSGLMLLFTFAFNADKSTAEQTKQEKTNSSITTKSIHSLVFLEPTLTSTFITTHKTVDTAITKWVTTFLIVVPYFKKYNSYNVFSNQDINRCIKVSILLFPFHYFW